MAFIRKRIVGACCGGTASPIMMTLDSRHVGGSTRRVGESTEKMGGPTGKVGGSVGDQGEILEVGVEGGKYRSFDFGCASIKVALMRGLRCCSHPEDRPRGESLFGYRRLGREPFHHI